MLVLQINVYFWIMQGACFSVKESDCWGSHLSRKNMPVASPKLTSIERESLQASAQYFGMKLKLNLGSLTKVKYIA